MLWRGAVVTQVGTKALPVTDRWHSADMNHLVKADLYNDVEAIISATDFIEMTEGAQLLFI